MILTFLHTINFMLEKVKLFDGLSSDTTVDPNKETTCCIFPLTARKLNLGSIVHYMEAKGFKVVAMKTLQTLPSVGFIQTKGTSKSIVPIPVVVVAIQGKDSVAMLYNYVKLSGYLCTSCNPGRSAASPMFCPATVTEARLAIGQLFPIAGVDLHDWERSVDWYIVRENC